MSVFGFFHSSEKDKLIKAVRVRKKILLREVQHLFSEGKKVKRIDAVERDVLKSIQELDPAEREKIGSVLDNLKDEDQILDHLAKTERSIMRIVESGNAQLIQKKLKEYIYGMNLLTQKLESRKLTRKAQIERITAEERKLEAEARHKAFKGTAKQRAQREEAIKLLKLAAKEEGKKNKVERKKLYRGITKVGSGAANLVGATFSLAYYTTKTGTNVVRITAAGTQKLAQKIEKLAR